MRKIIFAVLGFVAMEAAFPCSMTVCSEGDLDGNTGILATKDIKTRSCYRCMSIEGDVSKNPDFCPAGRTINVVAGGMTVQSWGCTRNGDWFDMGRLSGETTPTINVTIEAWTDAVRTRPKEKEADPPKNITLKYSVNGKDYAAKPDTCEEGLKFVLPAAPSPGLRPGDNFENWRLPEYGALAEPGEEFGCTDEWLGFGTGNVVSRPIVAWYESYYNIIDLDPYDPPPPARNEGGNPVADVCVRCDIETLQGTVCNPNNPSVFNNEGVLYRILSGGDASYANSIKSKYSGYVVDMKYCVNKAKTEGPRDDKQKSGEDATKPAEAPKPPVISKAKEAWGELAKIEFENDGWQSKDGKGFNWTRFGIDAAGAAVLATGAGILTNTLIKKSQLKGGYRNIQCVSWGAVANYGETFTVQ